MPERDGLEARRIRGAEKSSGKHLPIVAMTANTMRVIGAYLSGGMDVIFETLIHASFSQMKMSA